MQNNQLKNNFYNALIAKHAISAFLLLYGIFFPYLLTIRFHGIIIPYYGKHQTHISQSRE